MADLDYTVGVNTLQAEANLTRLQKSVGTLNDTFGKFRDVIATVAFSAVIHNALDLADTLYDLADATEMSTNKILGFGSAVALNGGTVAGAQKGMARLVASIDDAANSAGASREAFKDVGVSLTDLRTKSSSQIFDQAIKGLAGIDDVATRARLATQLLGREARNVNFKNVQEDFVTASEKALRYNDAIKSGAIASDNIASAIKTMQLEVVRAIQPITDFINNIKVSTDTLGKWFDRIVEVGKNFLYLAGAIGLIIGLVSGFDLLVAAAVALRAAVVALPEIFSSIAGLFRIIFTPSLWGPFFANMAALAGGLGPKLVVLFEAMGVNTAFIARHWIAITAGIAAAYTAAKEYFGLGKDQQGPTGRSYSEDDARRMREYLDEQAAKVKRGQEAIERFNAEVAKARLDSSQSLDIQKSTLQDLAFKYNFQAQIVGKTEDEKELLTAMNDLQVQRLNKQEEYARSIAKLQQEKSLTKDEEANKLLGARIGILQQEKTASNEAYGVQKDSIATQIKFLQERRMVEAFRIKDQEIIIKSIDDQIARQNTLNDLLRSANDQKIDVKFQTNQLGLGPLQKQINEITESGRKAALEAGRAFSAQFDGEMSAQQANELANGLDQIAQRYGKITQAQIDNLMASQTWSAGWSEAFATYKENAFNAADEAKTYFNDFARGFEDTIVTLVQGGKVNFRDFANSIIADFARIQARKMLVNAAAGYTEAGGLTGVFNTIGSMFGFAAGGAVQAGVPITVGERGPEMFIPTSAGTIVPNNAMSTGNSNLGQQTIVNYNIQAVDASSFRSLVARDPSFIYAVTEQGRRSQPSRRLG